VGKDMSGKHKYNIVLRKHTLDIEKTRVWKIRDLYTKILKCKTKLTKKMINDLNEPVIITYTERGILLPIES
jgi:hypothetical protein